MTFALRRGVSASNARTCGSKASKLFVLARRGGYFGGESEASARSTVFFAQPTSLAILLIDNPCPRRYRICALDGLVFEERFGLLFKERRQH